MLSVVVVMLGVVPTMLGVVARTMSAAMALLVLVAVRRPMAGAAGRRGDWAAALRVAGLDDLQIADWDRNRRDQVTVGGAELPGHRPPRVR